MKVEAGGFLANEAGQLVAGQHGEPVLAAELFVVCVQTGEKIDRVVEVDGRNIYRNPAPSEYVRKKIKLGSRTIFPRVVEIQDREVELVDKRTGMVYDELSDLM